ncbi:monocarboxylate transporter 6-like isoform X1 [Spodoptera litura]|uniref:Monocarboxylate transporter 6-like isoform X1 n=1 Tax=Spodoptera litura TaxID=69820 RepID=A0A9J7INI1_SPOLT|nr:monocarboxylate transporter 6-like isoform X1 [Spodoptera litura]
MSKEKKEGSNLMGKKYKLVPPDGGWGYLVAVSAIISFSTTTAFSGCFGMMYDDFMTAVSLSSANVTLLLGIFCVAVAFAGFFTSALLNIMSMRMLAFISSVIFACGTLGTVIMTTPIMFFLTAGVFQGMGLGIMYNLSCTIVNEYFTEKRVLVMSFVQTATGVNAMVAPIFVKWSLETFGSKGTLLLIGGISLNNFVAVMLMQPVQWHMKKVPIEVNEKTELKNLLEIEENKDDRAETPILKLSDLSDLEGTTTKETLEKYFEIPEKKKSGIRKIIESMIDTSLVKTFLLSCSSVGPATCSTADGIYIVMVPQYLYSMGWSQENVAMAITLYGFGDLATRVLFTVVSKWMYKLGIQNIYVFGVAIAALSRIGMLWSNSTMVILVYFTLMGVAHCSIAVLMPLVVSDAVAPEKFTSAMGFLQLLFGVMSMAIGPVVGAIRDITNSYASAFYTLISFYGIICVLWPIEMLIKRRKQRRKVDKEDYESSQLKK